MPFGTVSSSSTRHPFSTLALALAPRVCSAACCSFSFVFLLLCLLLLPSSRMTCVSSAHGLEFVGAPILWRGRRFRGLSGGEAGPLRCGLFAMSRIESRLPLPWQALVGLPEFAELRTAIEEEAKTPFRQMLSHHTTTSCQPGRQPGVVASLKEGGLDQMLGQSQAWRVQLKLENSYEAGDGLEIQYFGCEHAKFKDCQAEAALLVLMYLLANRPHGVHLHPSTLRDIQRVRQRALDVHSAAQRAPGVFAGALVGWDSMPARERPEPRVRHAGDSPQEFTPEAEQALREILATLPAGQVFNPGRLPAALWQRFAALLPTGQLKSVLQGLHEQVEVFENEAFQCKWGFRIIGGLGVPAGPPASTSTPCAEPVVHVVPVPALAASAPASSAPAASASASSAPAVAAPEGGAMRGAPASSAPAASASAASASASSAPAASAPAASASASTAAESLPWQIAGPPIGPVGTQRTSFRLYQGRWWQWDMDSNTWMPRLDTNQT